MTRVLELQRLQTSQQESMGRDSCTSSWSGCCVID